MARTIRGFRWLSPYSWRRHRRNNAVKGEVRTKSVSPFAFDHCKCDMCIGQKNAYVNAVYEDYLVKNFAKIYKKHSSFIYEGEELPAEIIDYICDDEIYSNIGRLYTVQLTEPDACWSDFGIHRMTSKDRRKHLDKRKRRNERREARRLKHSSLDSCYPSPEGGRKDNNYHREYSVTLGDPAGICQIYILYIVTYTYTRL